VFDTRIDKLMTQERFENFEGSFVVKRKQNLEEGNDNTAPTCFLEIRNRKAERAAVGFPCVRKATQKTRAEETKHDFCLNPKQKQNKTCLKIIYHFMHSCCLLS